MLVYFLCILFLLNVQVRSETAVLSIDPLLDQNLVDELWIDHMIVSPTIINLLGRVMLLTSVRDISLSTDPVQYIKYPRSLRATLLQISNGKIRRSIEISLR